MTRRQAASAHACMCIYTYVHVYAYRCMCTCVCMYMSRVIGRTTYGASTVRFRYRGWGRPRVWNRSTDTGRLCRWANESKPSTGCEPCVTKRIDYCRKDRNRKTRPLAMPSLWQDTVYLGQGNGDNKWQNSDNIVELVSRNRLHHELRSIAKKTTHCNRSRFAGDVWRWTSFKPLNTTMKRRQ